MCVCVAGWRRGASLSGLSPLRATISACRRLGAGPVGGRAKVGTEGGHRFLPNSFVGMSWFAMLMACDRGLGVRVASADVCSGHCGVDDGLQWGLRWVCFLFFFLFH